MNAGLKQNGWDSNCVWAPKIHFADGTWYVYKVTGVSNPIFIYQRAGVLHPVNDNVYSEYENVKYRYYPEDTSINIWVIDMMVQEQNGILYMICSGAGTSGYRCHSPAPLH